MLGNIGRRIIGFIINRAKESARELPYVIIEGITSTSPSEAYNKTKERHRREAERAAAVFGKPPTRPEVQAFIDRKLVEYRAVVDKERARGNRNYAYVQLVDGWIGNQYAILRYNMNNNTGRIDIFYGGNTANPMEVNNGHGHVVIKDGTVISWLEPIDKNGRRNPLY